MCVRVCGRGIRTPRGEIPMRGMLVKCGSVRRLLRACRWKRLAGKRACILMLDLSAVYCGCKA